MLREMYVNMGWIRIIIELWSEIGLMIIRLDNNYRVK